MKKTTDLGKKLQMILAAACVILAACVLWRFFHYVVLNNGFLRRGLGKFLTVVWKVFAKVLWATLPSLLLPIGIYLFVEKTLGALWPLIRVAAAVGIMYLFLRLSGGVSLSFNLPKMASETLSLAKAYFQAYYLIILILPQEFMSMLGGAASVVGVAVVALIPSLPGAFDDLTAVSTLIMMIFGVLNTSASLVKRAVAWGRAQK